MACGDPRNFKDNGVCPHCGHCQHCGRGGHQLVPIYPQPMWISPSYPWYQGSGWWGVYPPWGTGDYNGGSVTISGSGQAVTGGASSAASLGGGCISFTN